MRRRNGRAGLAAAAILLGAASARAGTNRLGGSIGFSNVNPEIRAILGPPGGAGLSTLAINATSVPPAAFSTHDLSGSASDPILAPWSLDVNADAVGITYRITASAELGAGFLKDDYYFLPVTSPPVLDPPAPGTDADVIECAGIIRVRFVDSTGAPVVVQGDRITADSSAGGVSPLAHVAAGSTTKDVVVRGDGSTWTVRSELTYGTDPFVDRMTELRSGSVVVGCDEIADFPVVVTVPGAAELSSIVGNLDVLGEDEVVATGSVQGSRSHVEATGPWRNLRGDALPGPPSAGPWRLENLVASTVVNPALPWSVKAEAAFSSGHDSCTFTTPSMDVLVGEGETVDVGNAFVIDPVRVTGRVLLAGPAPNPRFGALLQRAWRASDRDGNADGIPDDFARFFDSTCVIARGRFGIAPGATASALGAAGYGSVSGDWDPVTQAIDGSYRIVLGNLGGEPGYYASSELNLKLLDTSRPTEPDSYVDARVDVDDPGPAWELAGGASASRDRAYCTSRVTLTLTAPGGVAFYAPNAAGTGSFAGTNFLGDAAAYDATLWWARGTPNSVSRAAVVGTTQFLLPEGEWILDPTVNVPQPGGGVVITSLPSLPLSVGCRQSLEATPDVQVALATSLEPCARPGLVSIAGRADAAAGIDRIEWSLNGGAPQALCASCGASAPFAFDVLLVSGDDVIRVEATAAGGSRAAAELSTRVAAEPSALDARPGALPLRIARDPAGLLVSWEPEPRDLFALHVGSIAALRAGTYDHRQSGGCDLSGSSATLPLPASDSYVLVTSGCGQGEGSYGRDSSGRERPPSGNGCR